MRAVNADALIPKIKCIMKVENQTFGKRSWDFSGKCLAIVENEPTIEPERKTGEWIPAFDGKFTGGAYWFSCSKCKRIVPEVRNGGWNFCPQCGADMREGNNE